MVFQGDIEAVAQKSPKDLTQLFEQLSGSDELKQAYNDAQLKVKEAEEENAVVFGKKKTLMSQRKQIKEQKDEAEKHVKLVNELKELKTDRAMMKLFHLDEGIRTVQGENLKIVKSRDAHDEKNEANKVELEEKKKTKAQGRKDHKKFYDLRFFEVLRKQTEKRWQKGFRVRYATLARYKLVAHPVAVSIVPYRRGGPWEAGGRRV